MSKKTKAKAAQERKSQKSRRKAAKAALYESFRKVGQNQKSKRNRIKSKKNRKPSGEKHQHKVVNCGNPGCKKCFPRKERVTMEKVLQAL